MSKSINIKDLYVGQLVVRNDSPETQVYTVASVTKTEVKLFWKEGPLHISEAWIDNAYCYKPTLAQIEYSLHQNGPLVSAADI